MPSRRRLARVAAMQALFEWRARGGVASDGTAEARLQKSLKRCIAEAGGGEVVDTKLAEKLIDGIRTHWGDIVKAIEKHAPDWPMERMDPVSRAVLMVGAYELLLANDAPPAVVMDEAIEIAKEYCSDESAKFVNGVLNALAHAKK